MCLNTRWHQSSMLELYLVVCAYQPVLYSRQDFSLLYFADVIFSESYFNILSLIFNSSPHLNLPEVGRGGAANANPMLKWTRRKEKLNPLQMSFLSNSKFICLRKKSALSDIQPSRWINNLLGTAVIRVCVNQHNEENSKGVKGQILMGFRVSCLQLTAHTEAEAMLGIIFIL